MKVFCAIRVHSGDALLQPTCTRSAADGDKCSLLCMWAQKLGFLQEALQSRWSEVTEQVHSDKASPRSSWVVRSTCQGLDQWGAWPPQVRLLARTQKYHCFLSKEEDAKEQVGNEPTDKHQVLPHAWHSTSSRVALQAGSWCAHLSGLCQLRSHHPLVILVWPAGLGKAGPALIASALHPWHSALGPELIIWGLQEGQVLSAHVLQPSENLLPTGQTFLC